MFFSQEGQLLSTEADGSCSRCQAGARIVEPPTILDAPGGDYPVLSRSQDSA
jgi:hypothetical protein